VDVRDVGNVTVRSVRYLSGRTDDTVTVRLVPRSLGELQIAVRTGADGLDVVLTAASHAARDRLDGQIVGLRDALARDGIDVNRVTVQAPPTFDLSGQMPSHQHHQSQTANAPRFTAHAFREPETNPSEQHEPSTGRTQHDGGLNMLA
jgi:flagellar hook-length control protein FliK